MEITFFFFTVVHSKQEGVAHHKDIRYHLKSCPSGMCDDILNTATGYEDKQLIISLYQFWILKWFVPLIGTVRPEISIFKV